MPVSATASICRPKRQRLRFRPAYCKYRVVGSDCKEALSTVRVALKFLLRRHISTFNVTGGGPCTCFRLRTQRFKAYDEASVEKSDFVRRQVSFAACLFRCNLQVMQALSSCKSVALRHYSCVGVFFLLFRSFRRI